MAFGCFTVHAGDFKKSDKHQCIGGKLYMENEGQPKREEIPLFMVDSVEVATEESVKRVGGTVGWGLVGGALLGPVGLFAGLLCGGRGKDVTFVCKLNDDRKFLATAPAKVYTELNAAVFDKPKIKLL